MKQLKVSVSGERSDERLLTVPFEVFGPGGEWLAGGTASPVRAAVVDLPPESNDLGRVHVVARLPNDQRVQQTVRLDEGINTVELQVGKTSPHEWLQWVTPFRSLSHLQTRPSTAPPASVRRIGQVWMTLWALRAGRWVATDVSPTDQLRDTGMRQVSLDIPEGPHLLQVGGDSVAWRLVSLPPRGPVRVALTRSASQEGDAIEVTVGRRRPLNELIMSYLSRGAAMEAGRLADAWQAADLMLYQKEDDPVSAAAGAYLLLKLNRLDERRRWVDNLVNWFPYLADGAIVAAALALQRDDSDEKQVRGYLNLAVNRGLPVFALGASILVETMAAVHRGKKETKKFHAAYQAAQAYNQARCSTGAYFAFYGRSPAEPSWVQLYGHADNPAAAPTIQAEGGLAVPATRADTDIGRFGTAVVAVPGLSDTGAVLRIGREHDYRFSLPGPDPATVASRSVDLFERELRAPGAGALLQATEPWGEQRRRNAFTVFDGDE